MQQNNDELNLAKGGVSGSPAAPRGNGFFLGIYLLLTTLGLTVLLVLIWPSACPVEPAKAVVAAVVTDGGPAPAAPVAAAATPATRICSILPFPDRFGIESRLLAIVLISGALGSSVFAARAYATFRGLKRYDPDWNWWYVMRLPVGMGLALFLYMVLRGGLFTASVGNSDQVMQTANPFGFAAMAALAGMFAKEASDKLEEVFQSVFSTSDKQQPAEKSPVIVKLEPVKKTVKDADLALAVIGRNFDPNATVTVGENQRPARFKDAGRIEVTLTADDVAAKAKLPVVVINPAAKGGASSAADLAVG